MPVSEGVGGKQRWGGEGGSDSVDAYEGLRRVEWGVGIGLGVGESQGEGV